MMAETTLPVRALTSGHYKSRQSNGATDRRDHGPTQEVSPNPILTFFQSDGLNLAQIIMEPRMI